MMLSKEKATRSTSDRPESSVLFSLRELRRLEDERVKAEAEARMAQARDEEARRMREEEERRKRAESEREARLREDRLRVEEAERRARVEGELKLKKEQLLEEQRQRHLHARRFGRSAWVVAAVGAALFVAVGGGLAARASRQHQAEKTVLEREIAHRGEQARAAQVDFDARIRALEEKAHRDVGEAKLLGDSQRQKQAIQATHPRPPRRTTPPVQPTAAPPKPAFRLPHKPDITDDPLGDLPANKRGDF
jgi:hypothetical protein